MLEFRQLALVDSAPLTFFVDAPYSTNNLLYLKHNNLNYDQFLKYFYKVCRQTLINAKSLLSESLNMFRKKENNFEICYMIRAGFFTIVLVMS